MSKPGAGLSCNSLNSALRIVPTSRQLSDTAQQCGRSFPTSCLADLHVSLCQGEKDSPEARFGGARTANSGRTRSSHACLSAMVPAFAEPDIHSLSRILADRHRRLSVCSLPVLKQSGESLGSLISVAQSATAGPGSLRAV